jgi:hypothetical protein
MDTSGGSTSVPAGTAALTGRVARLEAQMAALIEAVEVLARGLESSPTAGPENGHTEKAARRAHELLLLTKPAAPGGPGEGGTSM